MSCSHEMDIGSSSQDVAFCCPWGSVRPEQQDNSLSLTQGVRRRTTVVWFGCLGGGTFLLWLFPVGGASTKPLPLVEEHLSIAEAKCPRWVWKGWAFQEHHQLSPPHLPFCWPPRCSSLTTANFYLSLSVSYPGNTFSTVSWLAPQGRQLGEMQEGLVGSSCLFYLSQIPSDR